MKLLLLLFVVALGCTKPAPPQPSRTRRDGDRMLEAMEDEMIRESVRQGMRE